MEYEIELKRVLKARMEAIEELKQDLIKRKNRLKTATDKDVIAAIKQSIAKLEYCIIDEYNSIGFCRNPIPEDVNYRLNYLTSNSFIEELSNSLPKDLPLRFHGSPIHRVKQIIESGTISSSVDRLGFQTSSDVSNQISTYDRSLFNSSITGYTDLTDIYKPLGCLFVLIDPNSSEANSHGKCSMPNFNLKDNPDKLFAILTSPESCPIVKDWCNQYGLDSNKVFEYNEFIEHMHQNKKTV